MYFPHNGIIITVDQLASNNYHPKSNLVQNSPWYVPSVQVDSALPRVNYVALCPQSSSASEKDPLNYYFPSRDLIPIVDRVISPMGLWDPLIHSFDPFSSHDFLDIELPLQEELFEAIIFSYQRIIWPKSLKGFVLQNYYV